MDIVEKEKEIGPPRICLNMIVKNESRIIKRMLESVLPLIDCYCICDTGSTDNTIEVIETFFKEKQIPGKIVHEPFQHFAHNRNVALKACHDQPADYVLLMDADMKLKIGAGFQKSLLGDCDSYHLLQGNESFFYENMRIVKNNGQYTYYGVTHEYVSSPPNNKARLIPKKELFIEDIGDGGSKSNKIERDIQLLLGGIKENPNSDRYHFYLANTYHDAGRFEEAIETYKKRIQIGGWEQEVWYSYYRVGMCYKKLNKMPEALFYWLEGYHYYDKRVENLYEIMHYYRNEGKNKLVKVYYDLALRVLENEKIMEERTKFLFLHNDIYTYKIFYEFSIVAAYVGVKNINKEAVAILNHCQERGILNNLLTNMKFYKHILKAKKTTLLSFSMEKYVGATPFTLYSSSSSLLPSKKHDGYIMNIRCVNYRINEENGSYLDCDKHILSTNKYIELDKNLIPKKEGTDHIGKVFDVIYEPRRYLGVEDVRLFYEDDETSEEVCFTGTTMLQDNTMGMVYGKYNLNKDILKYRELSAEFNKPGCEKNWVFASYKGSKHVVYRWCPMEICKINEDTCLLELLETRDTMPAIFKHVRGSTNGFTFTTHQGKKEIWFVTHLVSYESPRHYYHMFCVFDEHLNLLRYSAPFSFEGVPIEYTLGLIVEKDRVIVSYSVWDSKTKVAIYDKGYVDELLEVKNKP